MKSLRKAWSTLPQSVKSWAFYDFANSSYVLIYQAFLLPVLFSNLIAFRGLSLGAWGLANAISTVLGVILAVVIGHYADIRSRKTTFEWSIHASFIGMVILSIVVGFSPQSLFLAYVIVNSIFILSLSLSDSILPYLSNSETAFEYSGFAWGFGYLGGIASMVIVIVLQKLFGEYSWVVFLSVAVFYFVFSLYAINGLKNVQLNENASSSENDPSHSSIMPASKRTLLLIGYWLISECITVIILFYSLYASTELKLSTSTIGITLLGVQILAFPTTWIGGKLAEHYNHLVLLGISVAIWGVIIGLLVLNLGLVGLVLIVIFTSLVIGNSQSLLRAEYSTVILKRRSGFHFGIYAVASEVAVFVGPVAYGFASDYLKSQKIPLFALFLLMVIGYALVGLVMSRRPQPISTAA